MTGLVPMPLVDDFLVQYTLGQAILLLFILVLPVGLVLKSQRISGINIALFGLLFVIMPSIGGGSVLYALLGIVLLVVGPLLVATADR